jgi:hypothetical protein
MSLPSRPVEFPIWRGRRGLVNTAICGVLGFLIAFGLAEFVERSVVVPGCTAYGQSHGMTYLDYKIYTNSKHESGACIFRTAGGHVEDVSFREAISFFADLWLGIAFKLELTVPSFILLLGLARSIPYFIEARRARLRIPANHTSNPQ